MSPDSTAPGVSASRSLIWEDATAFREQRERTAHALAAIGDTLQARRPLGGGEDEFLALHERASRMDEGSQETVWSCPAAHAWTLRTFAALRDCIAEPDQGSGALRLQTQLDAFPLFVEALAHIAGVELARPTSHSSAPAVHLPGTRLVREAAGLVQCPVVRHEGAELALLPEALCVPGAEWPDAALARDLGVDFHLAHAETLRAALALIQRHQLSTFTQIREHIRIVALVPEDARLYPNASSSEHPGAVLLGGYGDPYDLADHLIHEFHHNRLFALESQEALLESHAGSIERFYSPWRDELRSMRGLVHGAYVFVPVHDYWVDVREHARDEAVATAAAVHASRVALQLRIAVGVIERHARLTPMGASLIASIVDRIGAAPAALDAPPATRALIAEHVRRYDAQGQASHL